MVKEALTSTTRDSSIKKRRKNSTGNDDGEGDIYRKFITLEETEATKRSAAGDAELYHETCTNIKNLLDSIVELKTKKPADVVGKVSEKVLQAASHVVVLKKLNRLEKVRSTTAREALIVEKQKTDTTHLQYQNLMYESAHLMSEYKKCKQFKSKDEDIELVSIEEFLSEAPAEKVAPFKQVKNLSDTQKHELHLARLEWELTQRKKLAELCSTLENEKKQVATEIVKSKNRLSGLAPKLATVLESTKPLQEYLGLPIEKTYAAYKLASLLPNSLYLLYANLDAYRKVYDIDLQLDILGDQDEAAQWKPNTQSFELDDSDTEVDQQEVEENSESKKRRRRKASHVDKQEEKKKKVLETHPLSILCVIKLKDGPTLKIQFYFCTILNIVTVTSDVECLDNIKGNSVRDVLSGESLLGELFTQDFGTESPNPSNVYQLKKIGINSFGSLTSKLGFPYLWAQKVCGIDCLSAETPKLTEVSPTETSCTNIEIVIKTIYKRLKSRTFLASQLQELEQSLLSNTPSTIEVPRNAVSTLSKWSSVMWQDYCKSPSTADLIASEFVGQNDLFYSAIVSRPNKSANLHALIVIKNNYPIQVPIFSLTVKHNGEFHSGNCDAVRDMERAINVTLSNGEAFNPSWLLSTQLHYLCAYFDVYLETAINSTFPQKAVFFKSVCARNRRRPFKFRKVGAGVFTQF